MPPPLSSPMGADRRAAATYSPTTLLPPWAPKRRPPPSRRQRGSPWPTHFHTHRCSRLMRQHGGEQCDLVTLTFDLLTLKMASESRVMWATSMPILVFLSLSVLDLGPMYTTDRCQTDVRQKHRLMPPPIKAGHNNRSGCIQNIEIYLSEWLSRVMALNTNCFGDNFCHCLQALPRVGLNCVCDCVKSDAYFFSGFTNAGDKNRENVGE